MGAALAEAKTALNAGDKADGAVAVLDEAMVARGHNQVEATGDPTAHAVMVVLREAARRLGPLEAVRACHLCRQRAVHHVRRCSPRERRGWARLRPARSRSRRGRFHCGCPAQSSARRLRDHAGRGGRTHRLRWPPGANSIGPLRAWRSNLGLSSKDGEVSEWLMVPLSKSGVRKHRGFESHPLRHSAPLGSAHPLVVGCAPSLTDTEVRSLGCSPTPSVGLAQDSRASR